MSETILTRLKTIKKEKKKY